MELAHQGEGAANRRTPLYGQMALAMKGFTPGATAEARLQGMAILKDLNIIKGENLSDGQMLQQATRAFQLAVTPKGQGSIANEERELIAQAAMKIRTIPRPSPK